MAFKMKGPMFFKSALKNYKNPEDYKVFNMGNKPTSFKQTDGDLKEFLISDKGFSQEDADKMMSDGSYDLNNKEFKAWYAESGKGDVDGDVAEARSHPDNVTEAQKRQAEDDYESKWENADEVD